MITKPLPLDLQSQVLSVSQFNRLIDEIISPLQVVVEGELAQINIRLGRWFFATLRDSQSSVAVFSPLARIPNWQVLQEGMRVRVDGWPKIYQKSGRFSLFARSIAPAGQGALKEALEKLKAELDSLGYFAPERKRSLPQFVRRLGLITAPGSRAYSDFVTILGQQPAGIVVDFYPVSVQGNQTVSEISRAIDFFNDRASEYDLLVITRGGGSLADLLPFNSRALAEKVYGAKVPVLSAIGHEEDDCLIDLVADIQTATPTAAAQFINTHHQQVLDQINELIFRIFDRYQSRILAGKEQAASLAADLSLHYQNQFRQIDFLLDRFQMIIGRLADQVKLRQATLASLRKLLASLDYRQVLRRGFTLTLDSHDRIIKSLEEINVAQAITTRFYRGKVVSQVIAKDDHQEN